MEKMGSSFYRIGEQPKPFIIEAQEEISNFFDGLPLFQPWVWKMFAVVGAASFLIGLGIGAWAYLSLAK